MAPTDPPPPGLSSTGRVPKPWDKLKKPRRGCASSPPSMTTVTEPLRELALGHGNGGGAGGEDGAEGGGASGARRAACDAAGQVTPLTSYICNPNIQSTP
jgi:hypothetical protein